MKNDFKPGKMKKIKVAILTYCVDGTKTSGISVYTIKLIENLKKNKNIELWLIHAKKDDSLIYENVNQIIIPFIKLLLTSFFLRYMRKIPRIFEKLKFDIVHDVNGVRLISEFSQKNIKTLHDMVPFKYANTQRLIDNILYKICFYLVNSHSYKIITDSQSSKEDIIKYLRIPEQKIKVVYIGYDKNKFKPIKNSEVQKVKQRLGKFILFVGTLEPRKNIVRLVQAFTKIKKDFPDYRLIIIGGNGWKYGQILGEIKKLNLNDNRIKLLGAIPHDELSPFYNAAELFVFPSLYEGFGLPPLEAMACGCPVITSNVSSLPEVVGDAALKVNPYNVDEIAEAMKKVLSDKRLNHEMTKKGLKQCRKFSWDKCAEETVKIYNEAMNEKK